jgi:hypothetical protein
MVLLATKKYPHLVMGILHSKLGREQVRVDGVRNKISAGI